MTPAKVATLPAPSTAIPDPTRAAEYMGSNWPVSNAKASEFVEFVDDPLSHDDNEPDIALSVMYPKGQYTQGEDGGASLSLDVFGQGKTRAMISYEVNSRRRAKPSHLDRADSLCVSCRGANLTRSGSRRTLISSKEESSQACLADQALAVVVETRSHVSALAVSPTSSHSNLSFPPLRIFFASMPSSSVMWRAEGAGEGATKKLSAPLFP